MKTTLTALGVLSVCTAARWYLDREGREDVEYAGGRVRLTALRNPDGAFGLKLPAAFLPPLSGALLGIAWTRRRGSPIGTGLLLGGGVSNLLERVRHGEVYDYVRFPKAPAPLRQYVFNLADFAILAGGVAMTLGRERGRKTK